MSEIAPIDADYVEDVEHALRQAIDSLLSTLDLLMYQEFGKLLDASVFKSFGDAYVTWNNEPEGEAKLRHVSKQLEAAVENGPPAIALIAGQARILLDSLINVTASS